MRDSAWFVYLLELNRCSERYLARYLTRGSHSQLENDSILRYPVLLVDALPQRLTWKWFVLSRLAATATSLFPLVGRSDDQCPILTVSSSPMQTPLIKQDECYHDWLFLLWVFLALLEINRLSATSILRWMSIHTFWRTV